MPRRNRRVALEVPLDLAAVLATLGGITGTPGESYPSVVPASYADATEVER